MCCKGTVHAFCACRHSSTKDAAECSPMEHENPQGPSPKAAEISVQQTAGQKQPSSSEVKEIKEGEASPENAGSDGAQGKNVKVCAWVGCSGGCCAQTIIMYGAGPNLQKPFHLVLKLQSFLIVSLSLPLPLQPPPPPRPPVASCVSSFLAASPFFPFNCHCTHVQRVHDFARVGNASTHAVLSCSCYEHKWH